MLKWVAGKDSDATSTTTTPATTTQPNTCPSEEIYGAYGEETALLRKWRDEVLAKTVMGQECIKLYYQLSPALAAAMAGNKTFKKEIKEILDLIVPVIREEME